MERAETGRRLRRWAWRLIAAGLCTAAGCGGALALYAAQPYDAARCLAAEASGEMLDRDGALLYPFLSATEQWCFPRGLDEVSPKLVQATLAADDKRFRLHPGVDPIAMLRAAAQALWSRRVVSGASTLTMQVVKLAGLDSSSMRGKLRQMLEALRLDGHVTKDGDRKSVV